MASSSRTPYAAATVRGTSVATGTTTAAGAAAKPTAAPTTTDTVPERYRAATATTVPTHRRRDRADPTDDAGSAADAPTHNLQRAWGT